MLAKVIQWMFFSVGVALVPLIWHGLSILIDGQDFMLEKICGRGHLLLITTAIGAGAVGELITKSDDTMRALKAVVGGLSILNIFLCSFLFADISQDILQEQDYDTVLVSQCSIWIFSISLLPSLGCLLLSKD